MNLVQMVTDAAKDQLLKKVSSALGESESGVSSALGSMIPTIIGSLAGKASTEQGASEFLDFMGKSGMSDGLLDNIGDMFGDTQKSNSLMDMGGSALGFLFGQNKVGSLIDIVSRFTGMGSSSSGSLMRMAAPFVISMIGRYIKQKALNPAAIASMFMGQKSNIQNAMPAGLMKELGGFSQLANFAAGTGEACSMKSKATKGEACSMKSKGMDAAAIASTQNKSGGGGLGWLIPFILFGAIAYGLYSMFAGSGAVESAKRGMASVGEGVSKVGDVAGSVAGTVGDAAGGVAKGAANVAGSVADVAKGGANMVGDAANMVGDAAKGGANMVGDAANMVGDAANTVAKGAGDAVGSMADAVKGGMEAVGDAAGTMADGATNVAKAGMGAVEGAAKSAGDAAMAVASIALPGDAKISTPKGSFSEKLVNYLSTEGEDGGAFNFDRVNFQSGSAQLTADSAEQLGNLVKILNAYEGVAIEVQGHTDNTGNPQLNQKLSMERASSVKSALVAGGLSADRIGAKGFGQEQPIADNSTEEGRLQNRRVSVAVMQR